MIEPDLDGLRPWAGLGVAREAADVVVVGLPFDGAAVYRRGAAEAPAYLRRLSAAMPAVDERGRVIPTTVYDAGDLDLPNGSIEHGWRAAADAIAGLPPRALVTAIGGDHTVAVPILAGQARRHPGLAVLWVDAHPDLCDQSRGGAWTCGCALRRALEAAELSPPGVAFAGCRDFDPEEVEWMTGRGAPMKTTAEIANDPAAAGRELAATLAGRPVHVSIDIDVLDPAFAPGTEIPSAGGLSTRELLSLLAPVWAGADVVGLDVVEYCPPADVSDITGFAALKVIFEAWSALSAPGRAAPGTLKPPR